METALVDKFLGGFTWKGYRGAGQTHGEEMFCFVCLISVRATRVRIFH